VPRVPQTTFEARARHLEGVPAIRNEVVPLVQGARQRPAQLGDGVEVYAPGPLDHNPQGGSGALDIPNLQAGGLHDRSYKVGNLLFGAHLTSSFGQGASYKSVGILPRRTTHARHHHPVTTTYYIPGRSRFT